MEALLLVLSMPSGVPKNFRSSFKAPEEITAPAFPKHARYGARAGQLNSLFLDSNAFIAQFLASLAPYAEAIGVIVFEFPAALATCFEDVISLSDALGHFFEELPNTSRYAVEIRSELLLCAEYFRALRNSGIAHVFTSWTEMPSIREQVSEPDAFTTNFTVSRALMKPGRKYEESVFLFAPYASVQEPNMDVRNALKELLVRSKQRGEPIFI